MLRFLKRIGERSAGKVGIPGSLSGNFDIRGDSIAGWVDRLPIVSSHGMKVQIIRDGLPIAECSAGPPVGERLPFTMSIVGHFTVAELIREKVRVAARSGRGDTGTLSLEGATALELIRDHLGVPAETILDLDFTQGGNARPYLGGGWSAAEDNFTWTEDDDSFVNLASPTEPGPYRLRMRIAAFITVMCPMQSLDIFVNQDLVASFRTDTPAVDFREIRLSGNPFAQSTTSTIRLHHPNASRPSDHTGSGDRRRLAFSFRRLSLVRILEGDE